jgi:hypothetical protein
MFCGRRLILTYGKKYIKPDENSGETNHLMDPQGMNNQIG